MKTTHTPGPWRTMLEKDVIESRLAYHLNPARLRTEEERASDMKIAGFLAFKLGFEKSETGAQDALEYLRRMK